MISMVISNIEDFTVLLYIDALPKALFIVFPSKSKTSCSFRDIRFCLLLVKFHPLF